DWQTVTHQAQSPAETALGLIFSRDGKLNLREVNGQTCVRSVPSEAIITNLSITSAACSPDGRLIAGLAEQHLEIFDQATFRHLERVAADQALSGPVQFSPDGKTLLVRR